MRSGLRLAVLALALGMTSCGPNGDSAKPGPSIAPLAVASIDANASGICSCPQLPTVAEDQQKNPGGFAIGELGSDDFEALLSNRYYNYGLDWERTLDDLTNRIDPTGAYDLGPVSVSRLTEDEPLKEGFLSDAFINGPSARFVFHLKGHQDYRNDRLDDQRLIRQLLRTIARANHYGDREITERYSALAIAQWFADLLPKRPDYRRDAKANYMFTLAENARGALAAQIALIGVRAAHNPWFRSQAQLTSTYPVPASVGTSEFPLDDIDLANAALDVIAWNDGRGERRLRPGFPYQTATLLAGHEGIATNADVAGHYLLSSLVDLASMRAAYGGPAVSGSRLDAVACKAFNMLVTLTDVAHANSDVARYDLGLDFILLVDPRDPPQGRDDPDHQTVLQRRGVLMAVLQSTRFTAPEGAALADAYVNYLSNAASDINTNMPTRTPQARTVVSWLLPFAKNLTADPPAGVPADGPNAYDARFAADMQNFKAGVQSWEHVNAPSRLAGGDALVQQYEGTPVAPSSSGPLAATTCSNGSCTKKIDAQQGADPNVLDKPMPQVIVHSLEMPQLTASVDSLHAEEAFSIYATIRRDRADAIGDFLTVQAAASTSGETRSVVLKRIGSPEKTLGAYATVNVLTLDGGGQGATSGIGSSVANWGLRKFRGYGSADFAKLSVSDGETLTFSVPGQESTPAILLGFTNDMRQQIDRTERNFTTLYAVFDARLQEPRLDAQSSAAYKAKMRLIADAREVIAHKPGADEDFTDLTRAEIGLEFLRLVASDASALDKEDFPDEFGVRTRPQPAGFDATYNVTYAYGAERAAVRFAAKSAHDKMTLKAFRALVSGEIALYQAYLAAQCDVMKRASLGLAPCPEELWIMVSGTTATGQTVSGWGRAAVAGDLVWQAVRQSDEAQALEAHLTTKLENSLDKALGVKTPAPLPGSESYRGPRSQPPPEAPGTVPIESRSAEIEEELVGDPTGQRIVTAPVDASELQIGSAAPPPAGPAGSPAAFAPPYPASQLPPLTRPRPYRPAVASARVFTPPSGARFFWQTYDNTCFLTVVRWLRNRRGLGNVSESEFAARAVAFTNVVNATRDPSLPRLSAYGYKTGSNAVGMKALVGAMGAQVKGEDEIGHPMGVADMKTALGAGYDVAATVTRIRPDGSRRGHAVAVIQIVNGEVIYGDPWSGEFWITDECSFDNSIAKGATLFIKWN